jgi:hypothetical protein
VTERNAVPNQSIQRDNEGGLEALSLRVQEGEVGLEAVHQRRWMNSGIAKLGAS